ncbi:MAG: hypothetical protein OEL81_07825, partial [Nitrosopumilus sp.]|nr:hypothetical protein [Nitrosopumilus sp.]
MRLQYSFKISFKNSFPIILVILYIMVVFSVTNFEQEAFAQDLFISVNSKPSDFIIGYDVVEVVIFNSDIADTDKG